MNAREEEAQAWEAVVQSLEEYLRTYRARQVMHAYERGDTVLFHGHYVTTGFTRFANMISEDVASALADIREKFREERDEQIEQGKAAIKKAAGS